MGEKPMKDFAGKSAFVTGGAGGIGFAMARAFGLRGMRVAIADVEADTCAKAVDTLKADGIEAIGFACDVADRDRYAEVAGRVFAEFGKVHVLCNNAGVSRAGGLRPKAGSGVGAAAGAGAGLLSAGPHFMQDVTSRGFLYPQTSQN